MIGNKHLLALIPARGGSKRLPKKNSLSFSGKPLIAWSIEAGLKSKYVDEVIVSTDDIEIAEISKKYGATVPFMRPIELASDTSSTIDVVRHAIEYCNHNVGKFDYIVVLQPTSPLRTEKDIDASVEMLSNNQANGIIGVTEIEHPVEWINVLPDDLSMDNFFLNNNDNKRSQDFPVRYRVNGAIYLGKIKEILESNSFLDAGKVYAHIMDKASSVDIDCKLDFDYAEFIKNAG